MNYNSELEPSRLYKLPTVDRRWSGQRIHCEEEIQSCTFRFEFLN